MSGTLPRHIFIPDTQQQPGVPDDHLEACGNYIVDKKPDVVVHIGDHWDMPSLNSFEKKGSKYFHDKAYQDDIEAGQQAMERLLRPLWDYNDKRKKLKERQWWPRMVFLHGNHEYRVNRAVHENPVLEGAMSPHHFRVQEFGWEEYPFLQIVEIDGILYSHYFCNPESLKLNPIGGTIENKLRIIGRSFTMGHQQHRQYGTKHNGVGEELHGLVCGCLTPDHKVLTADLIYKPIGDLEVGEKLVSFDEYSETDGMRSRRYKTGTLLQKRHEIQDVYEVKLASGKVFKTTPDHGWLYKCGSWYQWITTDRLREGMRIPKLFHEWEQGTSFEAGWLSGMYDGEGSLYIRKTTAGYVVQLSISQKEGDTFHRIKELISAVCGDDTMSWGTHSDVHQIRIQGGANNIAKVLGILRPNRLLDKFSPDYLGRIQRIPDQDDFVKGVNYLGKREIVKTDVDEKTMIVEGYPHHNSFYQHDEEYPGPQGNNQWRGIVMKNEVYRGSYDPCFVSMSYLLREWL